MKHATNTISYLSILKIDLLFPASSNLAGSLNVQYMTHDIPIKILVMLDAGDMMICLKLLANVKAHTDFSAYFTRWISILNSLVFTIVDCGRKLTNEYMSSQLNLLRSHLCPNPREAS